MAKYELVSFKGSPWVQRVAIVLREKKLSFDFVHIESGNRPDWFNEIAPHGKVPILRIDGKIVLFESNAISEYLDEATAPRLNPQDLTERAIHRAWTDFIPTFAGFVGGIAGAKTDEALATAWDAISMPLGRLEEACRNAASGSYFSGERYALVDAGYAPFLQRYLFLEELAGEARSLRFPRVRQWAQALVARPTTHTFAPEIFHQLYLEGIKRRGGLLAHKL